MTTAADLALILAGVFGVWQMASSPAARALISGPPGPMLQPGSRLELPNVHFDDVGSNGRNIVLFVSSSCPSCNQSVSFYRQLSAQIGKTAKARLLVASNEPLETLQQWLKAHSINATAAIRYDDVNALGLFVVPTIAMTDSAGLVTDLMAFSLASDEEQAVLSRIASQGGPLNNATAPAEVGNRDLAEFLSRGGLVLDVSDRSSYRASYSPTINIPSDELSVRAPIELSAQQSVIVDCSPISIQECRMTALSLMRAGVEGISILVE